MVVRRAKVGQGTLDLPGGFVDCMKPPKMLHTGRVKKRGLILNLVCANFITAVIIFQDLTSIQVVF